MNELAAKPTADLLKELEALQRIQKDEGASVITARRIAELRGELKRRHESSEPSKPG